MRIVWLSSWETKPLPLTLTEWKEIMTVQVIRESWGIEHDISPREFASRVYVAKYNFVSGSPGYVGDRHADTIAKVTRRTTSSI